MATKHRSFRKAIEDKKDNMSLEKDEANARYSKSSEALPTVEDYITSSQFWRNMQWSEAAAKAFAKEFAQAHLEAQKKAIVEVLEKKLRGINTSTYNAIMNTYPLSNVK